MDLLPGLREETLKQFLKNGRILTARYLDSLQIQITAISRDGRLLRGVLDPKSRLNRELLFREKYKTPYIVELPADHPEDSEHVDYSVSLPRGKRVIALRYDEQQPTTSTSLGKPKRKRIRTAAQLLGEKEDYCCRTCFKHFSRKFNLERHEEMCLPKPILYQCPVCHRKYQKAPYFAAHIRQHEKEEERQRAATSKCLAIEQKDIEEVRRRAEESVNKLAIPYEFGTFL